MLPTTLQTSTQQKRTEGSESAGAAAGAAVASTEAAASATCEGQGVQSHHTGGTRKIVGGKGHKLTRGIEAVDEAQV